MLSPHRMRLSVFYFWHKRLSSVCATDLSRCFPRFYRNAEKGYHEKEHNRRRTDLPNYLTKGVRESQTNRRVTFDRKWISGFCKTKSPPLSTEGQMFTAASSNIYSCHFSMAIRLCKKSGRGYRLRKWLSKKQPTRSSIKRIGGGNPKMNGTAPVG